MRITTRAGAQALVIGVAAALALAGCSASAADEAESSTSADTGSSELTPVKLQLQWLTQAQFAGYYAAVAQGYYEDEGLDVEIIPSGGEIG
ncbi:MAG: ABC transporter substrate-binding protein, partial [Cellulomonadaceae bacterium]|nr:ABC transporter substrate-binding protein [Cellulomonadaceae bacterium]